MSRITTCSVTERVAPAQPHLSLLPDGGSRRLVWTEPGFVLERAPSVTGAWTNLVPPAASPYPLRPASGHEFFRLQWASP
jgi:hypothetical protein